MEQFLRLPVTSATTAPVPVEFRLLRPYLDLGPGPSDPPGHVKGLELAWLTVASSAADGLPVQTRPATPAFRDRLTSVAGLARYALINPAELAPDLRTPRWQKLCGLTESFSLLAAAKQAAVTTLLASLGLYATLADLGRHISASDPECLVSLARTAHARAVVQRTAESQALSIRALEAVDSCEELPARSRLNAATTLVVLHARGALASAEQVSRYSRSAARHAKRLHPDEDWLDALGMSTYWRAVSFAPYLAGDWAGTCEQLDRAEAYARQVPGTTQVQRWVRATNLHPLLETRSIAAAWAGDLDNALRYAVELAEVDAMDGKTHIRLGDVYLKRGEPRAALRAYLPATVLGMPYSSLAWCKAALAADDISFKRLALACAHQADPAALTPLAALRDLARRDGDHGLAAWATDELSELRTGSETREEVPCAPSS